MSDSQFAPSERPDTLTMAASAGTLLREARELQGGHVAALAVALKVPVRQIEALEDGRLGELPDVVFARALAASVCRQLGIDPQPVLAQMPPGQPRLHRDREPINEPFRAPGESMGSSWRDRLARPPVTIALLLLLGAVILLALPLFQGNRGAADATTAPAAVTVPVPVTVPAVPAAMVAPEAVAPATMPGQVVQDVTPALPAASR